MINYATLAFFHISAGNYSLVVLNLNNKGILKGPTAFTIFWSFIYLTEIALICLFFVILSTITVHVATHI